MQIGSQREDGIIMKKEEIRVKKATPTEFIPEVCRCKDSATGRDHNFCYNLSRNIFGKKFDCSLLPVAKALGLLDDDIFDFEVGKKFPSPMFVTGSSEGHLATQRRAITTLQQMFPDQPMVFYDLGLTEKSATVMKTYCNVKYRKFPFERYPTYVRSLKQYRWKPLIIAVSLVSIFWKLAVQPMHAQV